VPVSTIEVLLVPEDVELDPGATQWGPQVRSLTRRLRSHEVLVRERSTAPVPGQKGVAAEIVLSLGSSGAIAAALGVLRGWLNQRSTRRVQLIVEEDGHRRVVELRADGLSEESARATLLEALRQRQAGEATETGSA